MATNFALACDALVRQRDRAFLERLATDYNLDLAELESKYLETGDGHVKVAKKVRKAKVTIEGPDAAPKCQATTAKKGPCSFAALKGECFCKRHLRQEQEKTAPKEPKDATAPKKVAVPVKIDPVHDHPVDDGETHAECELCQTHGNPLEFEPDEYEEAAEEDPGEDPASDFDDE